MKEWDKVDVEMDEWQDEWKDDGVNDEKMEGQRVRGN